MTEADAAAEGPDVPQKKQRTTASRLLSIVRTLLIVLVVVAAAWQLWVNWPEVAHTVAELQWHRTLLSLVAVVIGIMCSTMSWQVLLDDLGKPIGVGRGAQIFLVGQLGKYLPGSA